MPFYLCGVDIMIGLLVGVGAGIFATWFPGMLNMQAVSVAVRGSRAQGYRFATGMAVVFPLQAGVSLFFANYLTAHPAVLESVKQWAVVLLAAIAVVFLYKGFSARQARKAHVEQASPDGPFRRGLGISLLNVLNIPLFFAITSWLLAHEYLPNAPVPKSVYVLGIGLGALVTFLVYARLADWFSRNANLLTRNINFLIGGLLIFLAVVQAFRSWN